MTLLCDEGVDRLIVERLRNAGFDVLYVAEMSPGISDEEVLALARATSALLITPDNDFGRLVFHQRRVVGGVLLLRLAGLSQESKAATVLKAVEQHGREFSGAFSVLAPERLRIRPDAFLPN